MSQGMFLAKALYDNVAESADELGFRRGDVLTVVEQDTKGLEGWWLCSLRGKHGIAPGNRLKIISGLGQVGPPVGESVNKKSVDMNDQSNSGQQDYDVPPSHRSSIDAVSSPRRPSYDALRNFITTRKGSFGDDLYDTPPSSKRGSADNGACIYDTPPSSKRASSERTPPHSNRSSATRDSGSNLLSSNSSSQISLNLQQGGGVLAFPAVVRRRSGSYSSDATPGSNRSSLDRILCEEGPPIYETLSPATSTEQIDTADPIYDTPPSRNYVLSQANPASKSSLGSAASSESLLSNTSMSRTASFPDSARSSMDLPADIYDVPPTNKNAGRSRKQLSMDSGLGFCESPIRSRPSSSSSNVITLENLKTSQSSFDCKPSSTPKDIKRSKSLENAIDDLYDTPRNNTLKAGQKKLGSIVGFGSSNALSDSSGVYDIPPQVTRDSVISLRSDSSDDSQRFSSSSLDNDQQMAEVLLWDEILLDHDSALELLLKRQQDVFKATSRLSGFVNNTWRSKHTLEKTLYDIKVSCTLVRNSLFDFVDFCRGSVANAVRQPDRQLASRLHKYVSPLQNSFELVNKSFINLEDMKWQVSLLCEPLDRNRPDDLGQIALVAKDLMPEVKKVASFIQSNGSLLFKKNDGKKSSVLSKPPVVPKLSDGIGGKGPGYGYGKAKSQQHRPLPALPVGEKSPPTAAAMQALVEKHKLSMYEIKAALHMDDYAECDELPVEKDLEQTQKDIIEKCIDEYDYVQLDSRDTINKSENESTEDINKKADIDDVDSILKLEKDHNMEMKGSLNLSNVDDEMELVPVKENAVKNNEDSVITDSFVGQEDSGDISDAELSEQDLKTPVNVNSSSSNESDFILPSPPADIVTNQTEALDPNDRQVLVYYTEQLNAHSTLLANAVDAFIAVVSGKEPPNIFISHSKFVIVSAHKLVHIGDSIHRNLVSNHVSARIMHCANHLCDCLKASVLATKTAALQYPSAPAVQEMVDSVIAVSHAAHELKLVITQAAKQ